MFAESSHCQRWLLSEKELEDKRSELHQAAFGNENPTKRHENSDRSASPADPQVSLDETRKLLRFYEGKVAHICQQCRLPKKVQATALVYFKRSYLSQTVLTADPAKTLLICIYAAAKIEESYVSAEELGRAAGLNADVILRGEVGLFTTLQYDLVVWSPYRALSGLFTDIEDMRSEAAAGAKGRHDAELVTLSSDDLKRCRGKAFSALDSLMLTDAPLLYPPSVLALAALRSACRGLVKGRLSAYLARAVGCAGSVSQEQGADDFLSPDKQQEQVAAVAALLDKVDTLGVQGAQKVEQEEVTEIDRKVKQWKASNKGEGGAQQEAEAKARAEKREAKVKARQQARAAEEAALLGIPPPTQQPAGT